MNSTFEIKLMFITITKNYKMTYKIFFQWA